MERRGLKGEGQGTKDVDELQLDLLIAGGEVNSFRPHRLKGFVLDSLGILWWCSQDPVRDSLRIFSPIIDLVRREREEVQVILWVYPKWFFEVLFEILLGILSGFFWGFMRKGGAKGILGTLWDPFWDSLGILRDLFKGFWEILSKIQRDSFKDSFWDSSRTLRDLFKDSC